ncbi:MAG: CDP-alcohol phosphatidyltransferase family protein [Candidatus Kapaibacterium sp.]|jgi:CDP-diacylglycerol--glycerol-3-phosphate 3-phosphatidyltransferase|nr:CDP-alcohol phosphatidyltransferase family protein [Candidatus Kapabacteria bacterium]
MNIPNMISILRIILAVPVAYFIVEDNSTSALILGTIAGLTDFLDGYLARKLNIISDLGKILDPLADKFFAACVALAFILTEMMPVWFFLAVIIRDVLILSGGLYLRKKYNFVPSSNFEGKVTFFLILMTLLGVLLEFDYALYYGYYLCTAALIYSFISYLVVFRNVKRDSRNGYL